MSSVPILNTAGQGSADPKSGATSSSVRWEGEIWEGRTPPVQFSGEKYWLIELFLSAAPVLSAQAFSPTLFIW